MINLGKYKPTKESYKKCFLITILLLCIYVIENFSSKLNINSLIFIYIVKPFLWISITFVIWNMPNIKSTVKIKHRKYIYFWACNFGLIYIFIIMIAGFFDGLGKSPYSHSISGLIVNIIFVGSVLVGKEFIRSYLVNSLTKKENYLVFISIALLITITNFSFNRYLQLDTLESVTKFLAEYFIPELSQNLFAVYLVYIGGYKASIIYLGIIQGFHWFSPILPDLKWINTALIGILSPIFFMMLFKSIYITHAKEINKRQKDDNGDLVSWIFTCVISIGIMWFAVGVFPIFPSVIVTGSMEPNIKPGDIILIEKIRDMEGVNNLEINDVIQFKRDGVLISHRIIEIIKDKENYFLYKTKGDNNSGPDIDLVKPQDIKGIIKFVVPKIGWITLLIKSDKEISIDEIFF